MEIVKNYYNTYLPTNIIPRLSDSDFSQCGSLNPPKFKSLDYTLVMFFIPECRFCQSFSTEFTKFQKEYAPQLNTGSAAVDLSNTENSSLIRKSVNFPYSLGKVFPTIVVFYKGKPCSSYTGVRSADALKSFIENKYQNECSFKFVPCD